jgi:hypothetical protein
MPKVQYKGLDPINLHRQHGEIKRVKNGDGDKQGAGRDVFPGEVIEVEKTWGKAYLVEVAPAAKPADGGK